MEVPEIRQEESNERTLYRFYWAKYPFSIVIKDHFGLFTHF